MFVHYFCIIICVVFVKSRVIDDDEMFRIDIIHYNDFHARFEETSVSSAVCKQPTTCMGGFARLYEAVQSLKAEKPEALLLNAGDSFQGTYWYTLLKWNVTQRFMNLLPHDAHAIGNHEFDDGVQGLAPYLSALKAPVLAANMDATLEPKLQGLYQPHIVIQRGGRKIGIIGLVTADTASTSSPDKVKFNDPRVTAQLEAKKLTEQGVDIIIVLSHCGLPLDKEIASDYGENIDIIVGGHSHSLLWNGKSPSGEEVSGPYPVIVESTIRPTHKILIVTASAFTKYLGDVAVWFNKAGEWKTFEANPIFLNTSIPENEEVKSLLAPYTEKLHMYVETVVGVVSEALEAKTCGAAECALGNLVADSLLEAAVAVNVSNLTNVAFVARNTLRGDIPKGPITRGGIINTVPFGNAVQTFSLKGRYLLQAIEHSVSYAWIRKPFNGPALTQVAGLRVTFNTSNEAGYRVLSVFVKEKDDYQPLKIEQDYQVTTYSFIAKGGDGYQMVKDNLKNLTTIGIDAETLEIHVRQIKSIVPTLQNRLTILN